jgi:5'-3' exonuclease
LVYIAIDGPAPRGKMIQQRHRRYRKIMEKEYLKNLKQLNGIFEEEPWDTSNITPGTKFMLKLSNALKNAAKEGLFSSHAKIDVILSDGSVPGEGEHKFMSYIKNLEVDDGGKVCIFSNDGDLLVLCNRFVGEKEILLLTEPNQTSRVVQEFYQGEEFMYILFKEFQNGLIDELELQSYDKTRVINDYIFITFFGGNDFVKHFPFTMMKEGNTFNLLIKIYKMLLEIHGSYLISFNKDSKKPHINTAFFKDFIAELAKREEISMINKQKRYNNSTPDKMNENLTKSNEKDAIWKEPYLKWQNNYYYKEDHPEYEIHKDVFKKINYEDEKKDWKPRYYQHFFDLDTTNSYQFQQEKAIVSLQYIKSLVYTLHYYLDEIPSWTWFYPYRMAPFPSDVQATLHNIVDINSIFKFEKGEPFLPFDQLMLVLPPQNLILPKMYKNLMSNQLSEFYPNTFTLDILAGEKYIYSEPILPEIDLKRVLEETKKLASKMSKLDLERNVINFEITLIN